MSDKKEEIRDISWQVDSESAVVQKEGPYALQRTSVKNAAQISEDNSYQEARDYAKQVTLDWSIQKAGFDSKQKAKNFAVQVSDIGSFQEAGYCAMQRTTSESTQIAGDIAVQYGESKVKQKAGRASVQIGGEQSEQFAGDYSVQCAEEGSFQSAGDGSVSVVYGKEVRCRHRGQVLQVLVFRDRLEEKTVILSKLIDDDKEHLLKIVKENGKWVLKDTIIE